MGKIAGDVAPDENATPFTGTFTSTWWLKAIEVEAGRLSDWFGGTRVLPRFPSPLSKALA